MISKALVICASHANLENWGARRIFLGVAGALALLGLTGFRTPLTIKLIFVLVVSGAFVMTTWVLFLTASEKAFLWDRRRSLLVAE